MSGISFSVNIDGYKKSITALNDIQQELVELDDVLKGNKVAQQEYIKEVKKIGGAAAEIAKNVKNRNIRFYRYFGA